MKILLTQPEIEQILQAHVLNTITLKDGSTPTIKFTATRGDAGVTAEIDIPYSGMSGLDLGPVAATAEVPDVPSKTGRGKNKATNVFANAGKAATPADPTPKTSTQASSEDAASSEDGSEADGDAAEPEPAAAQSTGRGLFDN